MKKNDSYVDLLMQEWGIEKHSRKLRTCMRRALGELRAEAQLMLRAEPKLQVVILPDAGFSVWAYFPIHRRRDIVRRLNIDLKPTTRVLLLISDNLVREQPLEQTQDELRDHFGHVLLYLSNPKAPNHCKNAMATWRKSCR